MYNYNMKYGKSFCFNYSEEELNRTGIYKITNLKNKKIYIGMTTKSFLSRWTSHIRELSSGNHVNKEMIQDWILGGYKNFKFDILEFSNDDRYNMELIEYEYMKKYNTFKPNGYNTDTFRLRKNMNLIANISDMCVGCVFEITKNIKGTNYNYIKCDLGLHIDNKKLSCKHYVQREGNIDTYLLNNFGSHDIDEIIEDFLKGKIY